MRKPSLDKIIENNSNKTGHIRKPGIITMPNKKQTMPFVSEEGYKQGLPPAGSHYRIPSNTLYNPTPYRIKATPNVGPSKWLEPYTNENVQFPGASYVDEHHLQIGGGIYLSDKAKATQFGQYKTGGQKCPEGYINIDGKCIKLDSAEYRSMLDKGQVGTMQNGKFWGNKSTLPPVVIYNSKDKDTQKFYDKLKKGNPEKYQALLELGQKYGSPHVSLKNKAGALDFLDPNAFNTEKENQEGYYRPHYDPNQQRIYLGANQDNSDLRDQYIAELAHQKQVMDKGALDFNLRALSGFGRVGKNMVKNFESPVDAYSNEYDTPGSLEYQAHKEIEPKLQDEYINLLSDKYFAADYYEWPGTFSNNKPKKSYKKGGGYFPEYHSYTAPRMNNGGGLLSRKVTCSDCGWSWDAVDGGKDVMTCHKCGGMIKMKNGGDISVPDLQEDSWLSKYQVAGQVGADQPFHAITNPNGYKPNVSGVLQPALQAKPVTAVKPIMTRNVSESTHFTTPSAITNNAKSSQIEAFKKNNTWAAGLTDDQVSNSMEMNKNAFKNQTSVSSSSTPMKRESFGDLMGHKFRQDVTQGSMVENQHALNDISLNAGKAITAVGEMVPIPIVRYPSMALNMAIGSYQGVNDYKNAVDKTRNPNGIWNKDMMNAGLDVMGMVEGPISLVTKPLKNIHKVGDAAIGIGERAVEVIGKLSDFTNNYRMHYKDGGWLGKYQEGGTEYIVKAGDNLSKISRNTGLSVRDISQANNIADPNKIRINQKLMLPAATQSQPAQSYQKWEDIKARQDAMNNLQDNADYSGNEQRISQYYANRPEESYVVVDKQRGRMNVYKGNKLLNTFSVGTGENPGDAQTVTRIENGKVDWSGGNKSTGAGIYTVAGSEKANKHYSNAPSWNFVNDAGQSVGMALHSSFGDRTAKLKDKDAVNNRMSNGCVNGLCTNLEDLYKTGYGEGNKFYVLPEDKGNTIQIVDGKPVLRVNAKNRTKYNQYTDQTGTVRKGQGINQTVKTLQYKPTIGYLDKKSFKNDVYQWNDFNDDEEYNNTTKPYFSALVNNKKKIMEATHIPSDVYNEIAKMSFGIYGTESNFGDTHSAVGNLGRAVAKFTNASASSSPDYKAKASTYGANSDNNSVGLTQIRWSQLNNDERVALKKLGITSNKDFLNPEKAATATTAILAIRYSQQLTDDQKKDIWKHLPTKWNSRGNYAKRVKNNSKYLTFKQLDNNLKMGGETNGWLTKHL